MPPQKNLGGRHRLHQDDEVTRRRVGDANLRGRLERPVGLFRLRDGLAAPGDLTFVDALVEVVADWERQVAAGTISDLNITSYGSALRRLPGVLERLGKTRVRDVDANTLLVWMRLPKLDGTPPAHNVMATRRSAARSFFQTAWVLGITDANPAKSIELPKRQARYVCALTDDQIRQLQRVARSRIDDTRRPAALALMMSGASGSEVATVTVADVDLTGRRVWVHDGGYRYRARWLPLIDDWSVDAIARRAAAVPTDRCSRDYSSEPADRLLVNHNPNDTLTRATTRMTSLVTDILKDSGVYQPGVNRTESIREWTAQTVFAETGSVEQVALRLGMASLDGAAHLVGFNWVETLTTDGPPAHRLPPGPT